MNLRSWDEKVVLIVLFYIAYIIFALVIRWRELRRLNALYPDGWEEVWVDEWMWEIVPITK